jgi:hypothetical protein
MTEVVLAGQEPASASPPVSAPEPAAENSGAQSPLALLRSKREALRAALFLDLAVPRWEAGGRQLWVRYGPGSPAALTEGADRFKAAAKPGDADWQIRANAHVLVKACRRRSPHPRRGLPEVRE